VRWKNTCTYFTVHTAVFSQKLSPLPRDSHNFCSHPAVTSRFYSISHKYPQKYSGKISMQVSRTERVADECLTLLEGRPLSATSTTITHLLFCTFMLCILCFFSRKLKDDVNTTAEDSNSVIRFTSMDVESLSILRTAKQKNISWKRSY